MQYWEHRNAPASVRAALLLGGAAILLLALGVYWALQCLLGPYAMIPAVAGPWITGWRNLGVLLGMGVHLGG
ncbi:MAG: hypothetical protein F7C33_00280 [Desulfurococcales archaeon]|nr:hypothetical protein [Desulfurococcales archaeon]